MSQFKFAGASSQYPLDAFFTVTVADSSGYLVGEKVTAGAVTADVSRIVDGTRVVVDGLKGGFTMSGNLVGATSLTTSAISAFESGQPRTRDVAGTPTEMMFGVISTTEQGYMMKTREDDHAEVFVATRLGLSKIQDTDASVAPVLSYTIPADGTYGDGDVMRFTIESNEYLNVAGDPRVAIVTATSAETVYAVMVENTGTKIVFEYVVDETTTTAGQIVSAAYDANGAVITDAGTATAVTPNFAADVTGILIA